MSRKPIRAELIKIIQNDCLKTQRVEKGLKTRKLKELFETITRLNIDLPQRLKDIRSRVIILYPGYESESDDEDETNEYFKDKEKRDIFISMFKKDYTENKENNINLLRRKTNDSIRRS
jgi:hypothetical protein